MSLQELSDVRRQLSRTTNDMFETVAAALLEKVCVTFELSYTATIRRPVPKAIFAIWVVYDIACLRYMVSQKAYFVLDLILSNLQRILIYFGL